MAGPYKPLKTFSKSFDGVSVKPYIGCNTRKPEVRGHHINRSLEVLLDAQAAGTGNGHNRTTGPPNAVVQALKISGGGEGQ